MVWDPLILYYCRYWAPNLAELPRQSGVVQLKTVSVNLLGMSAKYYHLFLESETYICWELSCYMILTLCLKLSQLLWIYFRVTFSFHAVKWALLPAFTTSWEFHCAVLVSEFCSALFPPCSEAYGFEIAVCRIAL